MRKLKILNSRIYEMIHVPTTTEFSIYEIREVLVGDEKGRQTKITWLSKDTPRKKLGCSPIAFILHVYANTILHFANISIINSIEILHFRIPPLTRFKDQFTFV